jgi:hypothetical protein
MRLAALRINGVKRATLSAPPPGKVERRVPHQTEMLGVEGNLLRRSS